MKPILVILNPFAGTKRGKRQLADLLDVFCKGGFAPIVCITQKRGDGKRVAKAYAGKVDRIVCIGGDGTFNEVVSGVLERGKDTPIGYIAAGSTNDYATSLGLSRNLKQAAQDIVDGVATTMDIGRMEDRYFTYTASFGAFTKASYSTDQTVKNTLGHMAYMLGALASVPSIRCIHVKLRTGDGKELEGDYLFGGFCNSTSVGGVVRMDPSFVNPRDGKFELLLVREPEDAMQFSECARALLTGKLDSDLIELYSVSSVDVSSEARMDWSLDGEFAAGREHVHLEVLPGAARIIIPKR